MGIKEFLTSQCFEYCNIEKYLDLETIFDVWQKGKYLFSLKFSLKSFPSPSSQVMMTHKRKLLGVSLVKRKRRNIPSGNFSRSETKMSGMGGLIAAKSFAKKLRRRSIHGQEKSSQERNSISLSANAFYQIACSLPIVEC